MAKSRLEAVEAPQLATLRRGRPPVRTCRCHA